jgi:hypothetical protein
VTVDSTTHVVPSHKVDLVLYVKVNDTNDTIGAHQTIDRVDDGVELGYHAQRVAHRDKLSTTSIRILVEVTDGLTLGDHLLAFVRLRFVLVKTEGARISICFKRRLHSPNLPSRRDLGRGQRHLRMLILRRLSISNVLTD